MAREVRYREVREPSRRLPDRPSPLGDPTPPRPTGGRTAGAERTPALPRHPSAWRRRSTSTDRPQVWICHGGDWVHRLVTGQVLIMVSCSWGWCWADCRVGGRRVPRSGRGPSWVVGCRSGGQVGAVRALTAVQACSSSGVAGQSACRCSQRLRWPRVSRAGTCSSRNRSSLGAASRSSPAVTAR